MCLKLYKEKAPVVLKSTNAARVYCCMAAATLAHLLGVSLQTIIKGLEAPINVSGRFEERLLINGKGVMIHDCYNANPESIKLHCLRLNIWIRMRKKSPYLEIS